MNSKRSEIRTEVRRLLNEEDPDDSLWSNARLDALIARKYSYWLKRFVSQSPENSNFTMTETMTTSGELQITEDFGVRHIIEVRDSTQQTPGVTLEWADSWDQLVACRRDNFSDTQQTGAPTMAHFERVISDHGDMTYPITGTLYVAPIPSSTRTLNLKVQLGPGSHMKHSDDARTLLPDEVEDCLIHDVCIEARLQEGASASEVELLRSELQTLERRLFTAARSVKRGPGRIRYYDVD